MYLAKNSIDRSTPTNLRPSRDGYLGFFLASSQAANVLKGTVALILILNEHVCVKIIAF